MIRRTACLLVLCLVLSTGIAAGGDGKKKAALAAAEAWLALVDGGTYGQSWEEAAAYFRNAVPREKWEESLRTIRGPLGTIASRKVKTSTYATTLPGAPDGEYVVVRFETSFAHKKSAVETVTPMRERDGTWRVSGYYIR